MPIGAMVTPAGSHRWLLCSRLLFGHVNTSRHAVAVYVATAPRVSAWRDGARLRAAALLFIREDAIR